MFMPPLYSVLIFVALAVLYFVIRWLHNGPLLESKADIEGLWSRWLARLWAFRTWVVTSIGGALIALPDLIVAVLPVDLTPLIGDGWAKKIGAVMLLFNAFNAAFKTKPPGQTAS